MYCCVAAALGQKHVMFLQLFQALCGFHSSVGGANIVLPSHSLTSFVRLLHLLPHVYERQCY
jgi:hypothetical protein